MTYPAPTNSSNQQYSTAYPHLGGQGYPQYFAAPQIPDPSYQGFPSQNPSSWGNPSNYGYTPFQPPLPPPQPPIPGIESDNPPPPPPVASSSSTSYPPLAPPPLPPTFPWMQTDKNKNGVVDPSLAFIPVDLQAADVDEMTKAIKKQIEEAELSKLGPNPAQMRSVINPGYPQALKELFQPLYCKLCSLTLSSTIVAMDHYKGKKHKKKVDIWMEQNRQNRRGLPPPINSVNGPGPGPGIRGPSGSNATPIGARGGVKRPAEVNVFNNTSKRFPLGRPNNQLVNPRLKKPKMDGAGPNFGYCEICSVTLTSQVNADQHYSGRPHKIRVEEAEKKYFESSDGDRRFGIGVNHVQQQQQPRARPPPPPPPQISQPQFRAANNFCPPRPHPPLPPPPPQIRMTSKVRVDLMAPVGYRQI